MPTVSVIIPTYNRAELLRQAINSVFAQTVDNYEIIVVDDGSTDHTASVIQSYADSRLRYVTRAHGGVSAARNYGIEMARGRYVAFLDSDDLFLPGKLEIQTQLMEAHADAGMVYSAYNSVDADGSFLATHPAPRYPSYREMLLACTIATPTVLARREALEAAGGFDTAMHLAEDIDLWCRITRRYSVLAVDEPLTLVRLHSQGTTRAPEEILAAYRYMYGKAFQADPSLSRTYKRRAMARIHYTCAAELLLQTGSQAGSPENEAAIDNYFYTGALYWPFSRTALAIFRSRLKRRIYANRLARIAIAGLYLALRIIRRGGREYRRMIGRASSSTGQPGKS